MTIFDYLPHITVSTVFAFGLFLISYIFHRYDKARKPVLDKGKARVFKLTEKIPLSPNVALYRFALPKPNDRLGVPIGQHISLCAEIEGKELVRNYTPVSGNCKGHFDIVVKTYELGKVSHFLSQVKIGDTVRVKGPRGTFLYAPWLAPEIGMIAGGTGLTPMLPIIREALKNPDDKTKIHLIFANRTLDDIVLKSELDDWALKCPDRFKVYYVLSNPPASGWTGGVGHITKDTVAERIPFGEETKILLCGPDPMVKAMRTHLADLQYAIPHTVSKLSDQVFVF